MELSIELVEILLLVAAIVAMIARRFRVPYTVGLVLAGIGLALLPLSPNLALTKEMVFNAFLPPLIFEAALYMNWRELRRDFPLILTLATLGVLLSAGVTAVGMHFLAGWEWSSAALLGVLIAATDPVSVIATFKESGVHGRLRLLVEAESLFNDGTAAVVFAIAVMIAKGQPIGLLEIGQNLLITILGGIFCGAIIAGAMLLLAGQTDDHLVEITFTSIAAYGSFILAEHFHMSGVLASLTAGILIGNFGHMGSFTDKGREAVESFWEYVAFVVNSLIFILIGFHETSQNFWGLTAVIGIALAFVILGRAVAIYATCALFSRSALRVTPAHQHILFWGGLRGALALALALGLPAFVPHQKEIITIAFALVAFSIFAQGLTITPLLRYMGEIP